MIRRALLLLALCPVSFAGSGDAARPPIQRLGTIACDMVEATPVVWKGRLLRFEYVRDDFRHKAQGQTGRYFRFVEAESGTPVGPPFASGMALGCALVDGDTMWVYGVAVWGATTIQAFWSTDLEHWQSAPALDLPGWGIFNTSVCRAGDRLVMAFEIDKPADEAGVPFTSRFAESRDGKTWSLLPRDHVFTRDRYDACPSLRYVNSRFYMTYLEARPGPTYETHLVRSADLVTWEASPLNPILHFSDDDRRIANPALTEAERERIARAENLNNSDMDFCEFQGHVEISYSWGNQQGVEHLARATWPGTLAAFLERAFPEERRP